MIARGSIEAALPPGDGEQERRIGSPNRRRFHKLTDVDTLRSLRTHRRDVEQPPADLVVDTDVSSPGQTAEAIRRHFGLTAEQPQERYPTLP